MKSKLFLISLFLMAVFGNAFGALTADYDINTDNSAQGLVYLSPEEKNINDISDSEWTTKAGLNRTDVNRTEVFDECWIYAKPTQGYRFREWEGRMANSQRKNFGNAQKRKITYEEANGYLIFALFDKIYDPQLKGVPAYFTVLVDGKEVKPDLNGDYYIAKGKPVKLTWDDEINCTFDATMTPVGNERSVEFTMPGNDLVIPLTSVTISDGTTEIKPSAFKECEKLTSVSIPNTITSIGKSAFQDCSSLKRIDLPLTLTRIDANALKNSGLTDAYYVGHKKEWNNVSVENSAFDPAVAVHWNYKVTFDANGHGGTAPESQEGYSGCDKVIKPNDLFELGYVFGGWYTDEACNNKFDFEKSPEDDLTLYAKWTPNDNIITFNTMGEGVEVPQQTVKTDELVTEPPIQNQGSRCIEGWYKDDNLSKPYDFSTPVKEQMTLYAKWVTAICSATVNVNKPEGGTCKLIDANGRENPFGHVLPGSYTLKIAANEDYTFSGSYTMHNRTTQMSLMPYEFHGTSYSSEINLTENIDLEVNVTFTKAPTVAISTKNDGVATGCSYTLLDGVKPTPHSYTDGSSLLKVDDGTEMFWSDQYDLTLAIKKGDYGCVGTIDNNGVKTPITNDQTSYTIVPHGSISISLFFYDNMKTYTLTFKNGDADHATITQTFGTAVNAPANPTREGYTFAGWDKPIPATMPAENMTINALWKKNITITANSDARVYNGKPLENGEFTNTSLEEGDKFESVTITGSQTNVGTSVNVPSAAVIKNAGGEDVTDNYDITYVNGTLEVTPKATVVKADDLMKEHDAPDPTLTATVTGLVMGDEATVISYSLSRDKSGSPEGEKAGSYTVTPTGSATQGNYTVTYETGLLTIAPKKGDVNGDESVDNTDIQIVAAVIFSGIYVPVADVNKDNVVNVADIVAICDIMNPAVIINF